MKNENLIILPETTRWTEIETQISYLYTIRIAGQATFFETYFDTFDWRIYNAGYILKRTLDSLKLVKSGSSEALIINDLQNVPVFIADLPDGAFKDVLSPLAGVRALTIKGNARVRETQQECLNADRKIVCRLVIRKISITKGNTITTVKVVGLRGYKSEARAVEAVINPRKKYSTSSDEFSHIMKAGQQVPGDYSSKTSFELNPGMKTSDALRLILKRLMDIIRLNESGVQNDIDTEFLHDYRVAVRRTRAVLSQLNDAFPVGEAERFKYAFSWLGKLSNNLRDLDVYLINQVQYEELAPASMREDINSLFRILQTERAKEYKKFSRKFGTKRYINLLIEWDKYLDSGEFSKDAEKSILEFVKPVIYDQFFRVVEKGLVIKDESPAKQLHKLRIECKKLRYLLEFFSSLFKNEPISYLVKQLKSLQDNLGEFNDYSVQVDFLHKHINQLPLNDQDGKKIAVAIGSLIGSLYQKQQEVRQQFYKRFVNFSSRENMDIATGLFK